MLRALLRWGKLGKGRQGRFQGLSRPGHHPPVLCLELRRGSCRPGASLHQAAALQSPKERPGENQAGTLAVRSAQGSRDGFP